MLGEVYRQGADFRMKNCFRPPPEDVREWRVVTRRATMARWSSWLETPRASSSAVEALQPVLLEWTGRQHGTLSSRLRQVLSGRGYFEKYLHSVARREPSTACHHYDCSEDSAQHVLTVCLAWAPQHLVLTAVIGVDLSLPVVIL